MAVAQRMNVDAYQRFVLSGTDGAWELHDGRLVEKPGMSLEHGVIPVLLGHLLLLQLDRTQFQVVTELRVRRSPATVFLPDLMVIPTSQARAFRNRPGTLAVFADPLPLIVEVWSPSTGDYDTDAKLPVYQQRGDREIWRIHPYERTLTAWVRQPDGSYRETLYREGSVSPAALPGVTIDLVAHFTV
jgi:Uma2 family endonuclease